MKRLLLGLVDRLTDRMLERASRQLPLIGRRFGRSFDIIDAAFFLAAQETAEYWRQNMITAKGFSSDDDLLRHALSMVKYEGLFLEFGVSSGRTTRLIADVSQTQVFGFDSFEGLPEDWRTGFPTGAFAAPPPDVASNVSLVRGLFSETLPEFVRQHHERVAFLHVDCDLYSSTKCIFDHLSSQIGRGCVIVFDEYFNYPCWQEHEHKAFTELVRQRGFNFRYDAFVLSGQQVCVVIE